MPKGKTHNFAALFATSSAAAILVGALCASSAIAQSAPSTVAAADDAKAEDSTIIVTGVRGKPRSALDSPTPVDVVTGKELAVTGHANLYQDLQTIVPSFNWAQRAGSGTASAVQTGALRGLNPDQTLVLVNGMRWHHTALINVGQQLYNGSAPVDLAFIPASGVDHVEVLREGAAAQYGSDAIAGVINVILNDSTGGSISARYGQNMDQADGQLVQVRANYGWKYSETGMLNVFFTAQKQDQSDRSYPIASNIQLFPTLANGQPDPREATINRQIQHAYGTNPYDLFSVGFNGHDEVGDVKLYSFGTLNRRILTIPYPLVYANNVNSLPQVYPAGFYSQFQMREVDGQLALGARGTISDWDWNLSSTAGEDNVREVVGQDINASLGPTSPTRFYLGTLISREWTNSLDVTRKLDLANAGSLQVSFGIQDRLEGFKIRPGDPASYIDGGYIIPAGQPFAGQAPSPGAQNTPGFRPSDSGSWSRNAASAYLELGYEPTDKLFIGVAGRYEHYSDSSGSSLVGKIDGRYKLNDWFVLRGSFGNGFRAPSLVQQHYSNARQTPSTATANLNQFITNQIIPVDSKAAIALGATPLRPEKSLDGSVGFTLKPASNFNITVDGYIVQVDHRIALTSILQGTAVNNILTAAGLPANLAAQYFTNAINTRTRGVDVVATYNKDLDAFGSIRLSAGLNLNYTKITNIIANPAALTSLGSGFVLFDRASQGFLTDGLPKTKATFGATWKWHRFDVNLQEIRYGKFSVLANATANDRTFPVAYITNLALTYHVSKKVSLTAGAENLFNHYPPPTAVPTPAQGYGQYPRTSPYGWTGGSYYGRVQVDF